MALDLTKPLVPVPIAWTDDLGGEWRFERAGDRWKVFRFAGGNLEAVVTVKAETDDLRELARRALEAEVS